LGGAAGEANRLACPGLTPTRDEKSIPRRWTNGALTSACLLAFLLISIRIGMRTISL